MNSYFKHESSFIDEGAQLQENCKVWHFSHIMSGAILGKECNIGQNVFIASGVTLGNKVKVQNNVSLYTGVHCEDEVFVGPSVVFTNIINPRSAIIRKDQYVTTNIRKGASIGANATILCGIEIGEYAMIGAGSVVVKNVKAFSLQVGNPSRQIGWVSHYGNTLIFDADGIAECPESNRKYQLLNGELNEVFSQ